MKQYLDLSKQIITSKYSGYKPNRTGVDSISLFGPQNEYDLSEGFPLITTKKVFTKGVIHELLWFLKGDTNLGYLLDNDVHIWDDNAFYHYLEVNKLPCPRIYSDEWNKQKEEFIDQIKNDKEFANRYGDLGPIYGKQWRKWKTSEGKEIDQIDDVLDILQKSPSSRRMIISAWNLEEVKNMALPPCHTFFQINVTNETLDCKLYQRSADIFLGVPFNIMSYSMLTEIFAKQLGFKPGRFVHTFGDAHIYCGSGQRGIFYRDNLDIIKETVKNISMPEQYLDLKNYIEQKAPAENLGEEGQDHLTAILEQLARTPKSLPKLLINEGKRLDELKYEDFKIESYQFHPGIKRRMAV